MKVLVRVDDVGRIPGDQPSVGSDRKLEYFRRWRDCLGPECHGIYGVVPAWVTSAAISQLKHDMTDGETLAQHGFDHVPGRVSCRFMEAGRQMLGGPECYIPPFNAYDEVDLRSWAECGGKVWLGGFHCDHGYGLEMSRQCGLDHWSAWMPLYGRAPAVLKELRSLIDSGFDKTVVLTLHVPWDVGFAGLKELGNVLRQVAIPLEIPK